MATFAIAPLSASKPEGTGGITPFTFRVTRSGLLAAAESVDWAVAGALGTGTAPASAADFISGIFPAGTLAFAPGQAELILTIGVVADDATELNERFAVRLTNPTAGATIATASAGGIIQNDDINIAIGAAAPAVVEGDAGITDVVFTVVRTGIGLSLPGGPGIVTSVDWAVATAVFGADADDFAGGVLPRGTVTFGSGETSRTITVPVAGDTLAEHDEAFTLRLSGPTGGASLVPSASVATATILTDDFTFYSVAYRPDPVAEGVPIPLRVDRSEGVAVPQTVHWRVAGVTKAGVASIDAADFPGGVLPGGDLVFKSGDLSRTATIVVPIDGSMPEPEEHYQLILSSDAPGIRFDPPAIEVAVSDTPATSITIGAGGLSATERSSAADVPSQVVVAFHRFGDLSAPSSVDWHVGSRPGGSPTVNGADFVGGQAPGGTATFQPGQAEATATFQIQPDRRVEPDEGYEIRIGNPVNAALPGPAAIAGTILNDDAPGSGTVSIAALDSIRFEGSKGAGAGFTFRVTRSGDTSLGAAVDVLVSGSGPRPATGADFLHAALPRIGVVFRPGETSAIAAMTVLGNNFPQPDRGFTATLANPQPGVAIAVAGASAAGTIVDDDASFILDPSIPPDDTIAPSLLMREGTGSGAAYTIDVVRVAGRADTPATVSWAVDGAQYIGSRFLGLPTAAAGAADFAGGAYPSGSVSFAAGEMRKTISFAVAGDAAVEPDEEFRIAISSTSPNVMAEAENWGRIVNDDATFSIAALTASRAEGTGLPGGTPFTFRITRAGDTGVAHSVDWAVGGIAAGGTMAAQADDFVGAALPRGSVAFLPGETARVITVAVAADAAGELNESFQVTLRAPSPGAAVAGAPARGTILNDDIGFAIGPASVARPEGNAGTAPFVFTVTRNVGVAAAASVGWSVGGSGAAPADAADFAGGALPAGTLSFKPGETQRSITVNVAGDTAVERDEGFAVTLANASAGTPILTARATGIIRSDDASLAIAALAANQAEGTTGVTTKLGYTPFTFKVTRSGATSMTTTAAWSVAGTAGSGTLPAAASDFPGGALPSGTVVFAPGESERIISVNVLADLAGEYNERFAVTLANPSAGAVVATATAQGIIQNDDSSFSVSPATISLAEGDSGMRRFNFTVSRDGSSTVSQTVWFQGSGSGAAPANALDFEFDVLPQTFIFFPAGGPLSLVVSVGVKGDTLIEPDETFRVTLSNATGGAAIIDGVATGTILGDDVGFAIAPAAISHPEGDSGGTPYAFTVTRTGGLAATHTLAWSTAGATATTTKPASAGDFVGGAFPAGSLTFAPGARTATLTVMVQGDMLGEENERFAVTLSGAPAGTSITAAGASGIVLDDDIIAGTAGNDVLVGTPGPDVFQIGSGVDDITGGLGLDTFRFMPAATGAAATHTATLEDLSRAAGEVLDLSRIDAIAGTSANDAFGFIGTAAFGHHAGELRWQDDAAGRLIQGDVNGDAVADLTILVRAPGPVDAGWFTL